MENAVEIKHLCKKYDDFSLNDISLSVPQGTVLGIIGENGAGKSTLISSALGLIKSDYEKLCYFGLDLKTHEKEIKENTAVIFDNTHYNLNFTPEFIGLLLSKIYTNWDGEIYRQYLERFSLPLKKKLKKFSRGMKMKLEFAIAFSHGAKLLILDEATSGLDPIVRDDILNILREFTRSEEHTVIISSHITSDLDKISDYIAYIHGGSLIFMKPYDKLREDYGVIRAGKEILNSLNSDDIEFYIKEEYSYSILVKNIDGIRKVFKDLEITRPTLEEIMLFYAKGVK